jgi:hypothetical protein
MRSEWTRLSWVLEFKRLLDTHRDDVQFWRSVRTAASTPQTETEIVTALGASLLLTTQVFGDCLPPGMREWTIDLLPSPVRIWIEHYGEAILLADFPGTKLYLLLETALAGGTPDVKTLRRRRLFPMRLAPPVAHGSHSSTANNKLSLRIRRARTQLRYNLFRLRFHLVQGIRYLLEAQRWKRIAGAPSC